ncbi:Ferredoxin [Fundidesulfovibrio magnetotacticus]|uniref:Ferredoxin n=1 Tax=Fundidesulfovibrio magnetotacticus TaxID=2730080 RepID=A0A6V8M1T9_9BACT|nr:nitroreductase family protein [Fundidesulfovibrio magnetotacticus]GFK95906.1 Ferredoxin [Fundidesulfovibrio magnetotacticus]
MLDLRIDETLCIRCGECAADCPAGIITLNDLPEITDEQGCYKCMHCYAVCPEGALSILGSDPADPAWKPGPLPGTGELANLVRMRRSVRRFQDENLPWERIEALLQNASHAPTGVNARDVLFTVTRDKAFTAALGREMLDAVAAAKDAGRLPEGLVGQYLGWVAKCWKEEGRDVILRGAPHLLLASAPADAPCPVQDTHIALATFELLAASQGLGTLWDGLFMMALAVCPQILPRLGLPGGHQIGYAMLFGKPAVAYQRVAPHGPARVNALG